jgi:hypothetical protein
VPTPPEARLIATGGREGAETAICAAVDGLLAAAQVDEPPAPLELLASLRGVLRVDAVALPGAGRLVPVPGGYVVQVSASDSPGRQRFTLAHEICHTLLEDATALGVHDAAVGSFDEGRLEEYLCDAGAAYMLLHPRWLRRLAGEREPALDALFEVAAACEASAEATARQLAVLGVWDCSFVYWEPGYRKGELAAVNAVPLTGLEGFASRPEPKLRAVRHYRAPGQPFFPLRKSAPGGSSIAAALATRERTSGVERFDLGAAGEAWCESQYVGYTDGAGREIARVLTLLRWQQ